MAVPEIVLLELPGWCSLFNVRQWERQRESGRLLIFCQEQGGDDEGDSTHAEHQESWILESSSYYSISPKWFYQTLTLSKSNLQ